MGNPTSAAKFTHPAKFKQADLTRAVRGIRRAGEAIAWAEIDRDGTIKLYLAGEAPSEAQSLDAWRAKRNARAA